MKHFNKSGQIITQQKKMKIPYILLEFCQYSSLYDILRKSRLTESTARFIFMEILQGLNFCHSKKVFHYDIKPENILIKEKNGSCQIKIADFGLSSEEKCYTERGTPRYQNPQMLLGKQCLGVQADMFSLGIVLFIMIIGIPPFQQATLQDDYYKNLTINPQFFWNQFQLENLEILESFKNLVEQMLKFDVEQRLYSYQDILNHEWIQGELSTAQGALQEIQKINEN